MKKQIAAATVIGALLALACLFWEQESLAARGENGAATHHATHGYPSPFDRHLKYSSV